MNATRSKPLARLASIALSVVALMGPAGVSASTAGTSANDGSRAAAVRNSVDGLSTVGPDQAAAANVQTEAAARAIQDMADANGALGMYVDKATGEYVVVFPTATGSRLTRSQVSSVGLAGRVETRNIDQATIDKIGVALDGLHDALGKKGFGYTYWFDPEAGVVAVDGEAPESSFAQVEKSFPGLVTYRKVAAVQTTSWSNDVAPHFGGAWIQSSQAGCTSGWSMQDNNHNRWMVTAGHCFSNGIVTNMGTSIRDDAYSNWNIDVTRIRGHSYAGSIYADGANGVRSVKDGNDPVVGSSYCTTGRNSGFVCGWVDRGKNHSVCFPNDPCFHQLTALTRSGSGVTVVQEGDSGGPLFIKDASLGVGVRGIISGRTLTDLANPGGWTSLVQQYHSIADFYVSHAVTS